MNKIISFSLWGDNPKYTVGAIKNAELAPLIYPGWICRFYVGDDVPDYIKESLRHLDSEIIDMKSSGGCNGMFWRFMAADSDDIIISRDTDSRLGFREKHAVDEWLGSDKDFHIMRDHPYHNAVIMGGMWGARNGILAGISRAIDEYDRGTFDNAYQVDQNFLRDWVYPRVSGRFIEHDEVLKRKRFPSLRLSNTDFVGQVYDQHDQPQFVLGGE